MKKIYLNDEYYEKEIKLYSDGTIILGMRIKGSFNENANVNFVRLSQEDLSRILNFIQK